MCLSPSYSREVSKAINKTRSLYKRWLELKEETYASNILRDELEWTTTELRNSLRSIEWDLEDLEDTINILYNNFDFIEHLVINFITLFGMKSRPCLISGIICELPICHETHIFKMIFPQ
jgi:Syntaxin 6, N-terminal.